MCVCVGGVGEGGGEGIFLKYVIMEGNSKVSIRTVDTDVILLAMKVVQCLVITIQSFGLLN